MVPEPDYYSSSEGEAGGDSGGEGSDVKRRGRRVEDRRRYWEGGRSRSAHTGHRTQSTTLPRMTDDGLILPRKLVNPCVQSAEKQHIHKELMFNQRIGKNVLNQKDELHKEFEKRREQRRLREIQQDKEEHKSVFEKRLEEQALKLRLAEESRKVESQHKEMIPQDERHLTLTHSLEDEPEFVRVHAQLRSKQRTLSMDT